MTIPLLRRVVPLVLAGFAVLQASAQAGRTWVVDSWGNGDFREIYEATGVAQAGDVIQVNGGLYQSFALTRGVSIVGVNTPEIRGDVLIFTVPPGESASLCNFVIDEGGLRVIDCGGAVFLEDLRFTDTRSTSLPLIHFLRCDQAAFHRGQHEPLNTQNYEPTVLVEESRVRLTDMELLGPRGHTYEAEYSAGGPALEARHSWVEVVRPRFKGGSTPHYWGSCGDGIGGVGLLATASELLIHGALEDHVRGGNAEGPCRDGGPALRLDGASTVTVSRLSLKGGLPGDSCGDRGPVLEGSGKLVREDVLADLELKHPLDLGQGGANSLDLHSATPGLALLVISDRMGSVPLPGFRGPDLEAVDGGDYFAIRPVGGTDPSGELELPFGGPTDPALFGFAVHLQMAVIPFAPSAEPVLSNALSAVFRTSN